MAQSSVDVLGVDLVERLSVRFKDSVLGYSGSITDGCLTIYVSGDMDQIDPDRDAPFEFEGYQIRYENIGELGV